MGVMFFANVVVYDRNEMVTSNLGDGFPIIVSRFFFCSRFHVVRKEKTTILLKLQLSTLINCEP